MTTQTSLERLNAKLMPLVNLCSVRHYTCMLVMMPMSGVACFPSLSSKDPLPDKNKTSRYPNFLSSP